VRRLDPFVQTLPGGVAASPALGLGVLRMDPHLPTPPDGVEAEPAFGLGAPRLDPFVPMPPDGVAAVPSLDLDVQSLDLLVPTSPTASPRSRRLTSTCSVWKKTRTVLSGTSGPSRPGPFVILGCPGARP